MTTREDIVQEALSWIGTPFHDMAGIKGVGTDCLHLILRTFATCGIVEDFNPLYSPQWFQHQEDPLFIAGLQARGALKVVSVDKIRPADIMMYKYGRHAAHGGIVVDANTIVHAYKPVGHVCLGSRRELADKFDSAWSMFR